MRYCHSGYRIYYVTVVNSERYAFLHKRIVRMTGQKVFVSRENPQRVVKVHLVFGHICFIAAPTKAVKHDLYLKRRRAERIRASHFI